MDAPLSNTNIADAVVAPSTGATHCLLAYTVAGVEPAPSGFTTNIAVVPPKAVKRSKPRKSRKRSKEKVQSAMIGAVGRIVAQVTGAASSVVLGVLLATNLGGGHDAAQAPSAPQATARAVETQPAPEAPTAEQTDRDDASRDQRPRE